MSIRENNCVIQWIAYEQAYLCDVGEILRVEPGLRRQNVPRILTSKPARRRAIQCIALSSFRTTKDIRFLFSRTPKGTVRVKRELETARGFSSKVFTTVKIIPALVRANVITLT